MGEGMAKKKKTHSEMILDALLAGSPLLLKDITQKVGEASGNAVKIQEIGSLMTRLSNPERCEIGYFIRKIKTSQGFEYSLIAKILDLSPEEIYGLIRKTGKGRFTLEMVLKKIPELNRYVRKVAGHNEKEASAKTKAAKKKSAKKQEPEIPDEPAIQKSAFQDFKDTFREALLRRGGIRLNFSLTARLKKID
jgi:hypothetical protein